MPLKTGIPSNQSTRGVEHNTDFGQEIDRDLPLIERARALQWYKDIKFPMGEHAPREEKRLSKEGWLGSCSVRGGRPKPMVTEKHLFFGFYRRLLVHLLSTSTRRWNYIWYAIRLVVSISSDVKRYSSLRSGALLDNLFLTSQSSKEVRA